jgi:hypothetical protein
VGMGEIVWGDRVEILDRKKRGNGERSPRSANDFRVKKADRSAEMRGGLNLSGSRS